MMFSILIVDDHKYLVEDLSQSIDWGGLEIGTVYKAYSGYEAMEIIRNHTIDIVLTDILMPGMSGLQLIKEAKAYNRKIKCITISAYEDFEYAKEAILQQVNDYILKPATDEEIIRSITTAIQQLKEEWQIIGSYRRAILTIKENLPQLRDQLLSELLNAAVFSDQELTDKLKMYELPMSIGDPVALILIRIDRFKDEDVRSKELIEYAIINIAEEILASRFNSWYCKDNHGYLVFVVKMLENNIESIDGDRKKQALEHVAASLQENVNKYLNASLSVIVSKWQHFPQHLPETYRRTITAIVSLFGTEGGFFFSETRGFQSATWNSLTSLYQPPSFMHLLEMGNWEDAEQKLGDIIEQLGQQQFSTQAHILEAFFTISSGLIFMIHNNNLDLVEIADEDIFHLHLGKQMRTRQQLEDWATGIIHRLKSQLELDVKQSNRSIVKQVNQFIENNLNHDVSLNTIAEHVYLHPVYLSKLYKLNTGMGISDYIHEKKMEKASYWLKNTNQKIYAITEQLGYRNANYFSKIFKKQYGVSPQEFREL